MNRYNCKHKADNSIISGHGSGQERRSGLDAAAKAFRATTAIAVFGLPLVAGVATFLGYGVYKAYKRIASRS
jgi:hypothetical protein